MRNFLSGTPQFPFLWFEDTFESLQPTIWSKRVEDPHSDCWTVVNGSLRIHAWLTPSCYVRPEFQFGAWRLPVAGRIYGASIRLEGGGIPKTSCCTHEVQLGVNSVNYQREISAPTSTSTSAGPCGSNVTQCRYGYNEQCGGYLGRFKEYWNITGTVVNLQERGVCSGDPCFCGYADDPLNCNLPTENYTTARIVIWTLAPLADRQTHLSDLSTIFRI